MASTADALVNQLAQDIQHHDLEKAKQDVASIITRDTNIADPSGTCNRLYKDAQQLLASGVTRDQLVQLGFPKVNVESNDGGVILSDGNGFKMPVTLGDVMKDVNNSQAEALAKKIHERGDLGDPRTKEELRKAFVEAEKTGQSQILEERINNYLAEMGDNRRIYYSLNHHEDAFPALLLYSGKNIKDSISWDNVKKKPA